MTFVMLTAKGSIASAVEAMKQGAFDYLAKPVDTRQLQALLEEMNYSIAPVIVAGTVRPAQWNQNEGYVDTTRWIETKARWAGITFRVGLQARCPTAQLRTR